MSNKIPQEEWTPLPFMEGEHALSKIEYNATDLLVELDSFKEKRVTKIVFANVFSYRVTLEHFRWAEFCHNPNISTTLVNVKESHYIKWLETAGLEQIYESKLDLRHYMLQTYRTHNRCCVSKRIHNNNRWKRNMKQPLFTINSTFSEEEVVRFNKYVILHMFHHVRNVIICNIILLLFTVGMIVNDITSEDFPIGSIMMFLVIIIVNWSLYKSPIQKARKVYRQNKTIRDAIYIVKFYDDHYVVTCNEIESSIPFDKLYKIIETDTNYYLMASKVSGTIICKADCPNDFDVYIHEFINR